MKLALILLLISICASTTAETYPIKPMATYEPVTVQASVTLKNGTLVIENTSATAWKSVCLYAQCLDEPDNFSTRLSSIPAHSKARVSLALFHRAPIDGHIAQRLDGGPHGEIDDLLIICRSGRRKGRWYGMADGIKSTHINILPL